MGSYVKVRTLWFPTVSLPSLCRRVAVDISGRGFRGPLPLSERKLRAFAKGEGHTWFARTQQAAINESI